MKLFKRIICVLLIVTLVTALVACGGSSRRSSSSYSSSSSKTTSHKCYVCGETASRKYGSHYYCNYCYAMVKTVVEAD